jgi:segregation and condensation protein A
MVQVTDMLESMGGQALFSRIVSEDADRTEIVVTFLALLELIRRKRVTCYQHKLFDEIVIQLREAGGDYELPADEISY